MRKSLWMGLIGFWAATAPVWAANYGVFAGLNQYNSSYISSDSWLEGCVPDAMHIYTNATQRGSWTAGNVQVLTNAAGTKAAIRRAITNRAATAVSGDVFFYFHSSHGGNNASDGYTNYTKSVYLCAYDADYSDTELAADLAKFATGVKVVVMVDACHSGGLFQSKVAGTRELASAVPGTWDLAGSVTRIMDEDRAAKIARGVKEVDKLISASEIGWITAADYWQYSWDDTNGGAFTTAAIDGWNNGTCDNATYGDQDGYATFYELWNYAKDIAIGYPGEYDPYDGTSYETDAQAYNTNVLKATIAGVAGDVPVADQPPTIALNPAGTNKSVVFGNPLSFTVTATDADGLAVSLTAAGLPSGATAPSNSGTGTAATTFNWTPGEAQVGTYNMTFSATDDDGTTVQGVKITVTDGSTTADLLVSEYIEGSSNNKAIEIFNGTGADVDLAAGGYALRLYANGAASPSATINLSGTLANGDVHVVANTSANATILALADQTSGSLTFNGNDAVALSKGGVDIDVLGTIGVNVTNLVDVTKVRKSTVSAGTTTYAPEEWDDYALDTTAYLGSHIFGGGGATTSAPAFNAIGGQSATAGAAMSFTVGATGYPAPTLALQGTTASSGYSFTAGTGQLSYTPPEADIGEQTFTFTASNVAGVATQTVGVTVSAAPVTVPVASIANLSSNSFTVNWTAVTSGTTYQVQVAPDTNFSSGSGASVVVLTNAANTNVAPDGWTYRISASSSSYLVLGYATNYVQSPEFSTVGLTSLAIDFKTRTYGGVTPSNNIVTVSISTDGGSNWTDVGTVTPTNTTLLSYGALDASAYVGFASVCVRWQAKGAISNKGAGIQALSVTGTEPSGAGSILVDETVAALTYGVTGLDPETTYYVRVRGTGGTWSEIVSATTTASGVVTPDPQPISDVVSPANGAAISMQISTTAGITYALQYTTNLEGNAWSQVDAEVGTGGTITLQDAGTSGIKQFYRVVKP